MFVKSVLDKTWGDFFQGIKVRILLIEGEDDVHNISSDSTDAQTYTLFIV